MAFLKNLFGEPSVENSKAKGDVEALSKALKHKNWEVRLQAAAALGEIGTSAVLPVLVSGLGDATSQVRRAASSERSERPERERGAYSRWLVAV